MNSEIFFKYLKSIFGPCATFKEGQLESIVSTVTNHFSLVVQKTGWGKSMVYFLATKYFREHGYGPTIIVSPLLSLMRNQQDSASKLNLKVMLINGKTLTKDTQGSIQHDLQNDAHDIIFITPEQLAKDSVKQLLLSQIKKQYALFVIDEVHCVSEWGHDFRPSFSAIKDFVNADIVQNMHIHILATTATANDIVLKDLLEQFDTDINVIRGPLLRESLNIQVMRQQDLAYRYAWILEYLQTHKGSGIIYSLTKSSCEMLATFLKINGISAYAYHSGLEDEDKLKLEEQFYNNNIRALVATTALGMGYDKPDVAFVIHIQSPQSILEYYQQIGRAGRNLKNADAILMCGPEDERIKTFFIENALPSIEDMDSILNFIDQFDGVRETLILKSFNIKLTVLRDVLKHLLVLKLIYKDTSGVYHRSQLSASSALEAYQRNKEQIRENRFKALKLMNEYCNTKECYAKFISKELNDPYTAECGKCYNCRALVPVDVKNKEHIEKAQSFLDAPYRNKPELCQIEARRQDSNQRRIPAEYLNETGYFLCKYNVGLGELVARGKYKDQQFSDKLVKRMANMIRFLTSPNEEKSMIAAKIIVYIPSLKHPTLVRDFAYSVAENLKITCLDAIQKVKDNPPQKTMQNSKMQGANVEDAFDLNPEVIPLLRGQDVYLIDDMIDSGWTFTVVGLLLKQKAHVRSVTPLALANTSNNG